MAERSRTSEVRQTLHEYDITFVGRVVAYVADGNVGTVEALILWGDNVHGPSSTAVFDTAERARTSVAVGVEEGSMKFEATVSFAMGDVAPVAGALAAIVDEPLGTLSLDVRAAPVAPATA